MSRHYSPKNFFRNASNAFLKRYFTEHGVLLDLDFDALSETKVTPIYAAWLKLPEEVRTEMERDFQDIDALSCESGTQSILDEAAWHGENLAEIFATLESFHAKAFWTFQERPTYWLGASAFHHADSVPASYWRKRKNLIRAAAKVEPQASAAFVANMEDVLEVYQRPRNPERPLVCLDPCAYQCHKYVGHWWHTQSGCLAFAHKF